MKTKENQIRIRINDQDKNKLKKIAEKQRKTMSQLLSEFIYELIKKESK